MKNTNYTQMSADIGRDARPKTLKEIVQQAIDDKNEALRLSAEYFASKGNEPEYLRLCKDYVSKDDELESVYSLIILDRGE